MSNATESTTEQAVAAARERVEKAREVLARWESEQATAQAELESLQARAGEEVLDDPDAARGLTAAMTELRDRGEVAERAVAAQRPRVLAAESAYLAAEADALEEPLAKARKTLEEHQARTAELLQALEEHEGRFVPEPLLIRERIVSAGGLTGRVEFQRHRSELLAEPVQRLERQLAVLRELAAGGDPAPLLFRWGVDGSEVYPACVYGPDAVVPAGAYVASVARARARVAELENLAKSLPSELEEWERRQAEAPPGARLQGLETRRRAAADLDAQLARAREGLAQLQGARQG